MIPLYTYPGSTWSSVIQVKEANPSLQVVAIINPNSGPGTSIDPTYAAGIQQLQAAGVIVLGYDHTSYGARSVSDVESDASAYASWYHVNGLFFDEMASTSGYEGYYSTISAYAASLGLTMTVGNPGADVPLSYLGTVGTIVIYEDSGMPALSSVSSEYAGYAKSNFAVISYGDSQPSASAMQGVAANVGYVYFTDGNLPNPYGELPSYFTTEGSAVALATQANSSSSTTSTSTTSSVPVETSTSTTTITQTTTVTSTSTATAYTTGTATATTTTTETSTALATTTSTSTADATTTNTSTATTTITGTQTDLATVTSTQTATVTQTATTTSTSTILAPAVTETTTTSTIPAPVVAAQAPDIAPNAEPDVPGVHHAQTAGLLGGLERFLSAEGRLWSGLLARAADVVGQRLSL